MVFSKFTEANLVIRPLRFRQIIICCVQVF